MSWQDLGPHLKQCRGAQYAQRQSLRFAAMGFGVCRLCAWCFYVYVSVFAVFFDSHVYSFLFCITVLVVSCTVLGIGHASRQP